MREKQHKKKTENIKNKKTKKVFVRFSFSFFFVISVENEANSSVIGEQLIIITSSSQHNKRRRWLQAAIIAFSLFVFSLK